MKAVPKDGSEKTEKRQRTEEEGEACAVGGMKRESKKSCPQKKLPSNPEMLEIQGRTGIPEKLPSKKSCPRKKLLSNPETIEIQGRTGIPEKLLSKKSCSQTGETKGNAENAGKGFSRGRMHLDYLCVQPGNISIDFPADLSIICFTVR